MQTNLKIFILMLCWIILCVFLRGK